MTNPHPEDCLDAYLAGELSPERASQVRAYFEASAGRRGVIAGLLATARGEDLGAKPPVEASLEKLLARLDRESLADHVPKRGRSAGFGLHRTLDTGSARGVRWGVGLAVASSVLIASWIGLSARMPAPRPAFVATYATHNGQQATITLHDGSTVVLGMASRLDISSDDSTRSRVVRLSGEALFTVAHHGGLPFTVVAGTSITRVLGTTFLVRHYASDSATTVAVRDGKVMVGSDGMPSMIVTAARQAVVPRHGRVVLRDADPAQFTFASGVLTLNDVSLPAAVTELNRWYDVDLRLGDRALERRHLNGEFAAGSPDDLVNVLEWTFDLRVVRTGRILTLFPR